MDRKIVWTPTATKQLNGIVNYWNNRNKSFSYTRSIKKNLKSLQRLIAINPRIGKKTNYPDVLAKIFMSHFQVIYKVQGSIIVILSFWDSRQDPKKNKYL